MKDQEIIQLFFERSEQAIANLTVKYGAAIRKVSACILKDPLDMEECVNDTYLQIWNSIPPQRPERLGAFVCRVARNVSLNRHHFNSAHKRNSYFDSANNHIIQIADVFANIMYSELRTNAYTDELAEMRRNGYVKFIFKYPLE